MSKPTVFISSTFYDMKLIRNQLESYFNDICYETIMHERGKIAYPFDKSLPNSCLKSIESCDIFIGIVGGKFGSEFDESTDSISMKEIQKAIDLNKQIYIFIDKNVDVENRLYQNNIENETIKYAHVDDIRVHKFIAKIKNETNHISITSFDSGTELISYLKEQFASLLQLLLTDRTKLTEENTVKSLNRLYLNMTEEITKFATFSQNLSDRVRGASISINPALTRLKEILGFPCYFYATEYKQWVTILNLYNYVEDISDKKNSNLFINKNGNKIKKIYIDYSKIFNKEESLLVVSDRIAKEAIEYTEAEMLELL